MWEGLLHTVLPDYHSDFASLQVHNPTRVCVMFRYLSRSTIWTPMQSPNKSKLQCKCMLGHTEARTCQTRIGLSQAQPKGSIAWLLPLHSLQECFQLGCCCCIAPFSGKQINPCSSDIRSVMPPPCSCAPTCSLLHCMCNTEDHARVKTSVKLCRFTQAMPSMGRHSRCHDPSQS